MPMNAAPRTVIFAGPPPAAVALSGNGSAVALLMALTPVPDLACGYPATDHLVDLDRERRWQRQDEASQSLATLSGNVPSRRCRNPLTLCHCQPQLTIRTERAGYLARCLRIPTISAALVLGAPQGRLGHGSGPLLKNRGWRP